MKYLKTYENINNEPKVGDYVICDDKFDYLTDFENKNIGQIVKINRVKGNDAPYDVKYYNIPTDIMMWFIDDGNCGIRPMSIEEIIYFSPDKQDVERYLIANKYNL